MDSIAKCIKETGNWSKLKSEHRFDHPKFDKNVVLEDIKVSAPKLDALLSKIKELDEADMKRHGKLFKHFIYSDVKSAYGAKLIASALAASGLTHAYSLKKGSRGMSFAINDNLNNSFATLTSVSFFEKPIGVNFRKDLLRVFNSRPDNIHGEKIRFIILDSGFREGIDLFDIKYVHVFEPIMTRADEKQAVGRATRFCGQKGLEFDKRVGWPINVFRYETEVPREIKNAILAYNESIGSFSSFFELFMKFTNIDPKKITFANELEPLVIMGAVDRYLNRNVHNFSISRDDDEVYMDIFAGGAKGRASAKLRPFQAMQKLIRKDFIQFSWPPTKIENGCEGPIQTRNGNGTTIVNFSPTQNFVRHFFTSTSPYKGMLLMHSIGSGKTCSAIAVASSSFEQDDYTIIYVTRHTLKGDVWKNMFGQTCNIMIQDMIEKGIPIPDADAKKARLIKAWMEPMSYKQFSNMIEGKSSLHGELLKRNGSADTLKKTLVVIDEAHKLFAPDVVGTERPNVDAIVKALQHSYSASGKDSARLLLMTATPYTDDPMDMMRLLNMCRENATWLPEEFDAFASKYLDETGKFTDKGKWEFLDDITGYVSYLNRERDVRSFSYPIFEEVRVPMSDYEFKTDLEEFISQKLNVDNMNTTVEEREKTFDTMKREKRMEYERGLKSKLDEELEVLKSELTKCKERTGERIKAIREQNNQKIADCKKDVYAECLESMKMMHKVEADDLKEEAKAKMKECPRGDKECREAIKAQLKRDLEVLKDDLKFDKRNCKEDKLLKRCIGDVEKKTKIELEKLSKTCVGEQSKFDEKAKEGKKEMLVKLEQLVKDDYQLEIEREYIESLKKNVENKKRDLKKSKEQLDNKIGVDRSQRIQLEKCLKSQKVRPAYLDQMNGKFKSYFDPSDLVEEENPFGDSKTNVFIINGHGGENIVEFEKRTFVMPQDKILVVFPVCGRPNYLDKICKFTDYFMDKQFNKLFLNPVKHKKVIEDLLGYPIRIYVPGDKCPKITTNLIYDFNLKKTVLGKSGVFRMNKIPAINRERLPGTTDISLSLGSDRCFKYSGIIDNPSKYNPIVHNEIYKGNIFAPAQKWESYTDLTKRNFKIEDIMEQGGPGIYYFTGCRSSSQKVPVKKYEKILENSTRQQNLPKKNAIKSFDKYLVRDELSVSPDSPLMDDKQESTNSKHSNDSDRSKSTEKKNSKGKEDKVLIEKDLKQVVKDVNGIKKQFKGVISIEELIINESLEDKLKGYLYKFQQLEEKLGTEGNDKLKDKKDGVMNDIKKIIGEIEEFIRLVIEKDGEKVAILTTRTFKGYYEIYKADKYGKFVVNKKLIGVMPVGASYAKAKCDAKLVIEKIKKAFKIDADFKINLPSKREDWGVISADELMAGICSQVKGLKVKK